MDRWQLGPGSRCALAIGLAAVVALGLATSRPEAGNFLRDYQTLIAAIVAMGAAFVAYDGATAATREQRRKEEAEREAVTLTTCLHLASEVKTVRGLATALSIEIERNPQQFANAENAEIALMRWQNIEMPHLRHAYQNIGAYNRDLRGPILRLWAQYQSSIQYVRHAVLADEDLLDVPDDMRGIIQNFRNTFLHHIRTHAAALQEVLEVKLVNAGIDPNTR